MYIREYAYICPGQPASGESQPLLLSGLVQAARVLPTSRTRLSPNLKQPSFMCGLLLLMDQPPNDWDLQAVVRSCGSLSQSHPDDPAGPRGGGGATEAEAEAEAPRVRAATRSPSTGVVRGSPRVAAAAAKDAASLYDLEYLDLDRKPFLLATPSQAWAAADDGHEVMISFPAAVASTSGVQPRVSPGRKPVMRTSRPKKSKKSQLKKVVCEVPVADGAVSSDLWAWRKYGQKPIKGSPYPRGYYKCSSMKGCMARKMVERSVAKPGVLIITYMAEHCHPVPTQINALAGTTRQKTSTTPAEDHPTTSPKSHDKAGAVKCEEGSNETPSVVMTPMDGITEEAMADDEEELWLAGMDDFFAPDCDHDLDEDGVLARRLSL